MCYLKECLVIILYVVSIIDSEQWYPVTGITDQTSAINVKLKTSLQNNLGQVHDYLPVFVSTYDTETSNKSIWHFAQYHNSFKKQHLNTSIRNAAETFTELPFSTTVKHSSHTSFENRDILQNSNKTFFNRPKRKILKRCPSVRPRQKKQRRVNQTRIGKFLKVFEVVQFDHVICTSSTGLEGTCLHEYDCQTAGGTSMGSCVDGYATCCVFQIVCDGRSSSTNGWFTNPGFPAPSIERISCTIALDKSSTNIQQIRLDFLIFELLSPTSGTCEDDQFVVSGQNTNHFVPILCGINTGQHVYIEVGDVNGPIYLSIQSVTREKRIYAIKISQLTKSDELAAPKGCLQYHKDDKGYLESFNYRDNSVIGIPRYPSYLNNLNYAMCIERSSMSCSITYTNAEELQIPNYDTDGLPLIPPKQAGVEIFNCPSDWLLLAAIRLCGERLNDGSVLQDFSLDAPVTDNGAGPLVVWFKSDGGYVGRGFKLYFLQNTCTVSV